MVRSSIAHTLAPAATAALLALSTLAGCSGGTKGGPPDVVLVTIDTLRADHMSVYGYERTTTPFIDQLAENSTLFERCYSTSSWTAPSMASIFTSVHPADHGVRHGVGNRKDQTLRNQELLEDDFLTLAEALKGAGYRTYGVSSNLHMSPGTGMAQGFDEFRSIGFVDAPEVHETALGLKESLRGDGPFFLWVHYFDPHARYVQREPWADEFIRNPTLAADLSGRELDSKYVRRVRTDPGRTKTLIDLYDTEVAFTDDYLRRLFAEVLPEGRPRIAVVTADHGEAFGDHNQYGHSKTLFDEEVRVPFIVSTPDSKRMQRVDQPVGIIDVYPTILGLADVPVPEGLAGTNLAPVVEGGEVDRGPVVLELDRWRAWRAIVDDQWKLVRRAVEVGPDGQLLPQEKKRQLFDVTMDPFEAVDLARDEAEVEARLTEALQEWITDHPLHHPPLVEAELDAEAQEELRALGYLEP